MPNRSEKEPLERVHISIYRSDADKLRSRFGGMDQYGISKVVRNLIHNWLKQQEDTTNARPAPSKS